MTSSRVPQSGPTATAAVARARKKRRRVWSLVGGLLLVVTLIVIAAARRRHAIKPIRVTVEKAAVRSLTHVVTATGKVQPETEVSISPEVAGELISLPFKEGEFVRKGQVIMRIKPDFYAAQVDQQQAALAAAKAASLLCQANLDKAQQDLRRADELYKKKLLSDADYATARTAAEVARANFDASQAQIRQTQGALNQASDQLEKTTVYAPMDGTITVLNSEVGERVVGTGQFAGTEVMRIADLSRMEVRVKVNENDIVNVKVGDHAVISIDAFPGRKFNGTVSEIGSSALTTGGTGDNQSALAASASDEVTNFLVRIHIDDHEPRLRPGMSAIVDIQTQTVHDVVTVPIQSVTVRAEGGKTAEELQKQRDKEAKERTGNAVNVAQERQEARRDREALREVVFVREGDTVRMRPVKTGIADDTDIEIKSGLKPGEEVVSGGYAAVSRLLKDGSKIIIEKPANAGRD